MVVQNRENKLRKQEGSIFGDIVGLIITIICMIYLFPKLPFVTEDYIYWQTVGISTSVLNFLFMFISHLTKNINLKNLFVFFATAVSTYSFFRLKDIFPFDFSNVLGSNLEKLFGFIFEFTVIALIITLFVRFILIFLPKKEGLC